MPRPFDPVALAQEAWGHPPDWVAALASACDFSGLRPTAARLGVSPALVSLTLRNRHKGTELLEGRTRRRIMNPLCACPVLGLIEQNQCAEEQAAPLVTTNALRVELARACREGCPHYKKPKKSKRHKENSHAA